MYVQQQHNARMKENIVLTGKNKDTATEAMSVSWKNTAKSPARFVIKARNEKSIYLKTIVWIELIYFWVIVMIMLSFILSFYMSPLFPNYRWLVWKYQCKIKINEHKSMIALVNVRMNDVCCRNKTILHAYTLFLVIRRFWSITSSHVKRCNIFNLATAKINIENLIIDWLWLKIRRNQLRFHHYTIIQLIKSTYFIDFLL